MQKYRAYAAIGALVLGGLALTSEAASASSTQTEQTVVASAVSRDSRTGAGVKDWNGNCDAISFTTTGFTGWCDGTGPEKYGTWVKCSNGKTQYSSYTRAYGDRRGVYAGCTSGSRVASGFWDAG
ncbi:hypothetical protein ABTY20_06310 [Streptomyces sp. NPDC126497]|uniref:hypothetical protein n=1 Tax=Streptomyces sp. NPDC126497 TaxID=3155313 RepID=UPI003323B2D5